ncbi:hypothetical protein [Streptomyces sp. NPDC097640]|uniref:hypothetical protein n=1 Tax=Streptomyces sp. NPDC097640 TaxID=3157229 RepID=UPI0033339D58
MGQPVVQRRRQQQDLVRVERRPEPLAHAGCTGLQTLLFDELGLKQSLLSTHTMIIPHE